MNCTITLLPCGHYYCQDCMDRWFTSSNTSSSKCPLCRYDCSQPLKENLKDGYNINDMVPTAMLAGDSSSSTDDSSSLEEGEEDRDKDPADQFVFYCGDDPRAATIMATKTRTAMSAFMLADENDALVSLLEKYSQGENFYLILRKAMQAKQAWERQAAAAAAIQEDATNCRLIE